MPDAQQTIYGQRFDYALLYASQLHREQQRKGAGVPYIAHLLAVAAIVAEHGGSEDEAIAALLHDAVEDQGGRVVLASIRALFGDAVAEVVEACSDTDVSPKPPWCERKQDYLDHIPHLTPSALLVSAADKLHNARSILNDLRVDGDAIWSRFKAPKDGQLWYYTHLVEAFRARCDVLLQCGVARTAIDLVPLVDEFGQVVDALLCATGVSREDALAHVCVDHNPACEVAGKR